MGFIVQIFPVVMVQIAFADEGIQWRPLVLNVEVVVNALSRMLEEPPSHVVIGTANVSEGISIRGMGQAIDAGPPTPRVGPDRPSREIEPA